MARLLIREDRTKAKELIVKKNAVVIHPQDCVATAITALKAGEKRGDYVHVHNVESERGRGDWK